MEDCDSSLTVTTGLDDAIVDLTVTDVTEVGKSKLAHTIALGIADV